MDAASTPTAPSALSAARCRNCNATATSRFCAECGQKTALHPPSVAAFVHEFIAHNVAFEGPLWRSLHALVMRPGLLTTEYFAGRRARYIAPLRLYLTFSLILFALSTTTGGNLRVGGVIQVGTVKEAGPGTIDLRPGHYDDTGIAPLDRAFHRIGAMTSEQRTARVAASIKEFLPYVLIALVPLLALFLKLLYWNRGRLYGEHLVVAFHAQTAAFMFGCVIAVLPDHGIADALSALLVVTVVVQGVIAMKRVYGGRIAFTIARTLLLFAAYGLTAALAVAALTFASLAS